MRSPTSRRRGTTPSCPRIRCRSGKPSRGGQCGRYGRQGNTLSNDGGNRACGYRAGDGNQALSPCLRHEIPAACQKPAGSAGHRVSKRAHRALRSRLLLAQTPRLPIRNHAVQQRDLLGIKVRRERCKRCREIEPASGAGLDADGRLGVRDARPGRDRSDVLAPTCGRTRGLKSCAHHSRPPANRDSGWVTTAGGAPAGGGLASRGCSASMEHASACRTACRRQGSLGRELDRSIGLNNERWRTGSRRYRCLLLLRPGPWNT